MLGAWRRLQDAIKRVQVKHCPGATGSSVHSGGRDANPDGMQGNDRGRLCFTTCGDYLAVTSWSPVDHEIVQITLDVNSNRSYSPRVAIQTLMADGRRDG